MYPVIALYINPIAMESLRFSAVLVMNSGTTGCQMLPPAPFLNKKTAIC